MPSPLASLSRSTAPGAIRLSELARLFSEEEGQLSQEEAARRQRRQLLFRESWPQSLRRQALASAYALRPGRIGDLSAMGALLLREALAGSRALPYPSAALAQPDDLCGIARDLSVATLGDAYSRGLYPWCHAGPVKWWAPRTRRVGNPREIAVGEAVRRHARRGTLKFTFDRDFDAIIAACAAPRPGHLPLTWIAPKLCGLTRRCTTPVSPIPIRSGTIAASLLPAVTASRAAASLSGRACSPASQAQARSGSHSCIGTSPIGASTCTMRNCPHRICARSASGECHARNTRHICRGRLPPRAAGIGRACQGFADGLSASRAHEHCDVKSVGMCSRGRETKADIILREWLQGSELGARDHHFCRLQRELRMRLQKRADAIFVFVTQNGAGDVNDPATRLREIRGPSQQFVLRFDALCKRAGPDAPFGVGIAPPCAGAGARRIDQHEIAAPT